MTTWAKVLTFIVLLLSVFFAAVSTVLFAKKEDWRERHRDLDARYITDTDSLKTKLGTATSNLANMTANRNTLQTASDSLTAALQRTESERDSIRGDIEETRVELTKVTTALAGMTTKAETWEGRNEELRKKRDELSADLANLQMALTEAQVVNSNQAQAIAGLEDLRERFRGRDL